jgi:arginine repressor
MAKKAAATVGGPNKSELTRKYLAAHPTASVTEIVDGLKAEGIEISTALASKIKYDPSRKGGAKKGRRKMKVGSAKATSKNGASERGNKAEAIRQAAGSLGGKVRPRDVIAMLKEQGIEVSSAQVSTTLKAMGMRKVRRGRKPGAVSASRATKGSTSITIEDLIAAKKLVAQLGSIEAATHALSALAKLN